MKIVVIGGAGLTGSKLVCSYRTTGDSAPGERAGLGANSRPWGSDFWLARYAVNMIHLVYSGFALDHPESVRTMNAALDKHIVPQLGHLPTDQATGRRVQESFAYVKSHTYERRAKAGRLVKRPKLSHSTVKTIVKAVKTRIRQAGMGRLRAQANRCCNHQHKMLQTINLESARP